MSKSCANCGAEITEGAGICDNCGMPVSEAASSQEAPQQTIPAQPPRTPPLAEDSRTQLEQSERLTPSQAPVVDSAPAQDPYGGRRRRGVPRWLIRAAGLVGMAAAGLVGMATFWRRGVDAHEQNPIADSDTQQSMGVTDAVVQEPNPIDHSETPPDPVDELAPTAAPPPVTLPPDVEDTPLSPPEGPPLVAEPVGEGAPPLTHTPPPEAEHTPPVTEPPGETPEGLPPEARPPAEEPAVIEPGTPTLDPNLTDPTAPGPTLDTGLVVQIQDNLRLVVAINRNPDIASALAQDPTQLGQIEQDLGLAEPRPVEPGDVAGLAGVTELDVPEPDVPGPGVLDQDLDDQPDS